LDPFDSTLIKIIIFVGLIFLWLARAFFRVFLSPPEAGQRKPVLPGESRREPGGLLGEDAARPRTPPADGLLDREEPAHSPVAEREAAERRALERAAQRRTAPTRPLPRVLVLPEAPSRPAQRPAARAPSADAQARVRARMKARKAAASAPHLSEPAGDSVEPESTGLLLGLDPEAAFVLKEVLGPPRAYKRLPWGPAVRRG
jgi:hypothetical protein